MTKDEYIDAVLRTADENGIVSPPPLIGFFIRQHMLIEICMNGLLDQISRLDEPAMYRITELGRKRIAGEQ